MRLEIHIDSENAACRTREDVLSILAVVSDKIRLAGTESKHKIRDINGNVVGWYSISADDEDDLNDCPLDDDMLQRASDARTSDEDVPEVESESVQQFIYRQFTYECSRNGFDVREYHGRNSYVGPGVITNDIQKVLCITTMDCLWDNMGKQFIVYPKVQ